LSSRTSGIPPLRAGRTKTPGRPADDFLPGGGNGRA
jgi:hypothetical protein